MSYQNDEAVPSNQLQTHLAQEARMPVAMTPVSVGDFARTPVPMTDINFEIPIQAQTVIQNIGSQPVPSAVSSLSLNPPTPTKGSE